MRIGYVISGYNDWSQKFPGGIIKVEGQLKAFRKAGFEAELVPVHADKSMLGKLKIRVPFTSDGCAWSSVDVGRFDVLYIRRPQFVSKDFIAFLDAAKSKNPRLKILYEIPTYPYDGEQRTLAGYPLHLRERKRREGLVRYVDRIVDLSGQDMIWGIPTIQMLNGIDMDSVHPRRPSVPQSEINIICVASFAPWHAIDRLLEGMRIYYSASRQARTVHVHLLGGGTEVARLRDKAAKCGLSDCVFFYGVCDKGQMDEMYDKCTLAVASLGLHRIGIDVASTLKTREYLAKGIPFVYSGGIDVFNEDPVDFCLQVPADESPLNLVDLVAFCDSLNERETEDCLIKRIRGYAEARVSVDKAMKNVIDYLKEGCECAHEQ